MKPAIFILQNIVRKYLCHRDFLEKYNAENLQDLAQTQLDFEFFLDYRYQDVSLAAANGHLFASTDTGVIHCFGNGNGSRAKGLGHSATDKRPTV